MGNIRIKQVCVGGLFVYRNRVWRSLGALNRGSRIITAECIKTIGDLSHDVLESTDFADDMMVEPCGAERYFEFL